MDKELDAASSRSIELHISQCGACREIVADFREVDILVRGLPRVDSSPDFVVQLLERLSESRPPVEEERSHRSVFSAVMRFLSNFMDLLEAKKYPSKTLDEFGDFPPFSMGYIYFQLLDQTGRG
jgi:hypothetical protein